MHRFFIFLISFLGFALCLSFFGYAYFWDGGLTKYDVWYFLAMHFDHNFTDFFANLSGFTVFTIATIVGLISLVGCLFGIIGIVSVVSD